MQSLYLTVVIVVAWLVLCVVMWRLHRARQHVEPQVNTSALIAYASQTGNAQGIALAISKRGSQALNLTGSLSVIALNNLTLEHLREVNKVLFVVSTYGDGEAPDNGILFTKLISSKFKPSNVRKNNDDSQNDTDLSHLQYSIIALGDSTYPEFCAFGFMLNQLMLTTGAQLLDQVITVDNYAEQSTELASITPSWLNIEKKHTAIPEVYIPQYWQLTNSELLNPDCDDEALFQLSLSSIGPNPLWLAGDLIDIQPHQPKEVIEQWLLEHNFDGNLWITYEGGKQTLKSWLTTRELITPCTYLVDELLEKLPYIRKRSYSVASISETGQLKLVVRLFKKSDDTLGLSSGFLTHFCQLGSIIQGQIRSVNAHHNIDPKRAIILIGAGSGLAGLKAQIASRKLAKQDVNKITGDSWLIFGERNSNPQLPLNQLLVSLKNNGLSKLSCAYSQDNHYPKYVQDILLNEQLTLKQWIEDGAAIYVCGCLSGMGESVHQALIDILGQAAVEKLQMQQRYIRDVY